MALRRGDAHHPAWLRVHPSPAGAGARDADAPGCDPRRRAAGRRAAAEARVGSPAHADRARLSEPDMAGAAGRPQPPGVRLPLGHARDLPRQDRRHEGGGPHPAAVVREAQVGGGDPEGGAHQRSVHALGLRCRQQGGRCRPRSSGARLRSGGGRLRHRHRHRLARERADRRRAAAAGREDDPGPRLHLHGRARERGRGVARQSAGPPLRQRASAAGLHPQPRPHDALLRRVGRTGHRRALRRAAAVPGQNRGFDPVPLRAACRRCRAHARGGADGRGEVGAAGADGAPVPAV